MGKAYDVLNILHAIRQQVGRIAEISDTDWQAALDDAAQKECHTWTRHDPPDGWDDIPSGVVVSYYNSDDGCNSPVKLLQRPVTGGWLILNYSDEVAIFNDKWIFEGFLPYGRYGDPQMYDDGYSSVFGGALNSDETRLAICCYNDHCVRVFDHQDGSVLWTFGDGIAGNAEDNRLNRPRDCAWLPNGNLLVTSYNGTGQVATGTNNNGFIVELDGGNGSLVAIRLEYTNDNMGRCAHGGIFNPVGISVFNDMAYICSVGIDEICCFDVSAGFNFVRSYKKPSGLGVDAVNPKACCQGPDNTLIVYADGIKAIAAVKLDTGELAWYTGISGWDIRNNPENRPHELWDVCGLLWDDSRQAVLAADYGNRRIMALSTSNEHTIQYQVTAPKGYELVAYPNGYDPETGVLTVQVNEVSQVGSCGKPGTIVLAWALSCSQAT